MVNNKADVVVEESVCRLCREIQEEIISGRHGILIPEGTPDFVVETMIHSAARAVAMVRIVRSVKFN